MSISSPFSRRPSASSSRRPSASSSRRPSAFLSFVPLALRKSGDIDITLGSQQHVPGFVNCYSTHDVIKGEVVVSFERDTHFDDVVISFEGQTATYVEKIATTAPTTGRTTGKHVFLKLLQPIDPANLPQYNNATAGTHYRFPFTFVVPERLLPHICVHPIEHPEVKEAHLQLPPSFGDPMLSDDGHTLMDDLAPEMSRISYHVRVKIIKRTQSGKFVEIADKAIRVRLVPVRQEAPPMDISHESKEYELRKEKDVKKGLFKIGKIGRLSAETTQPRGLRLPAPRMKSIVPISTMATISLRFDPYGSNDQPPTLGSVVSKLRAATFFGATPYRRFPTKVNMNAWDTMKGSYTDSVELSSRCISTVTWTRHENDSSPEYVAEENVNLARRPSMLSTTSMSTVIPEPSASYSGAHFYTAEVLVPISLPKHKTFTPSFHSCIVSRSYSLEYTLSYHTPGTNVSNPSVVLKVPLHISSEGSPPSPEEDARGLTELEIQAAAEREVDNDFFAAAGLDPPSPEYTERPALASLGMRHASIAAPPAYFSGYRTVPRSHSVGVRAAG
jgi:hypothetical protein